MTILACGNCVYYALWQRFPPTSSWVVLIPLWFLALAAVRSFGKARLRAVPPFSIAVVLVLVVCAFAPGIIGPPLGFWIPVCCVVGTFTGLARSQPRPVQRTVAVITITAALALVGFGVHDDVVYHRMSDAERSRFLPVWEIAKYRKPAAS